MTPDTFSATRRTGCKAVTRKSLWMIMAQVLFLLSLLLYPFGAASHTLYLVPQMLFMAAAGYGIASDFGIIKYSRLHFELLFLGMAALAPAIAGELAAATPEYSEVGKLALNMATILLFLFSRRTFDAIKVARWLCFMAFVWLIAAVAAYLRSGTTFLDLAILFSSGSAVSSSALYSLAEPLSRTFLTKNIAAMYVVAVYGLFLYSSRASHQKIRFWQHTLFFLTILSFASRQAVLSLIVMAGIARLTSTLSRKRKLMEIAFAASAGIAVFTVLFNLSSPDDGAYTRIGLWKHFIQHVGTFILTGNGLHGLNQSLASLEIDNYHMFFMNQIGAYGLLHCVAFNLFLLLVMFKATPAKQVPLLIAPYWLNVCFQTYGYEYGNLFLLVVAANTFDVGRAATHRAAAKLPKLQSARERVTVRGEIAVPGNIL